MTRLLMAVSFAVCAPAPHAAQAVTFNPHEPAVCQHLNALPSADVLGHGWERLTRRCREALGFSEPQAR